MEKILDIVEFNNNYIEGDKFSNMEGWKITTDKQVIKLGIDNTGNCCERWGHFSSEDNHTDFLGANLLEIRLVDKALKVNTLDVGHHHILEEHECIFVNFETSKGTFQLAVYNSHNGYYGHSVFLESSELKIETHI